MPNSSWPCSREATTGKGRRRRQPGHYCCCRRPCRILVGTTCPHPGCRRKKAARPCNYYCRRHGYYGGSPAVAPESSHARIFSLMVCCAPLAEKSTDSPLLRETREESLKHPLPHLRAHRRGVPLFRSHNRRLIVIHEG